MHKEHREEHRMMASWADHVFSDNEEGAKEDLIAVEGARITTPHFQRVGVRVVHSAGQRHLQPVERGRRG